MTAATANSPNALPSWLSMAAAASAPIAMPQIGLSRTSRYRNVSTAAHSVSRYAAGSSLGQT